MPSFYEYIAKRDLALFNELKSKHVSALADVEDLPFDNVFGDAMRVIIPFESGYLVKLKKHIEQSPPADKKVQVDLNNGVATEEGMTNIGKPYKRVHRLAAFIQKNYPNHFDAYNKAASRFTKGENKTSNEYSIVLSRNPIDIARMSDHEGLKSCHSQGDSYFHCALTEAQGHGPIAYLVKTDDLNQVKDKIPTKEEIFSDGERGILGIKPIARIRVRRFLNKKDDYDLAVPEIRTYGKSIDGFEESLSNWLYDKQKEKFGDGLPDMDDFVRTGGSYTDNSASSLFNSFFKQNRYYHGDVDYEGEGGKALADQYDEECQAFRDQYSFKHVWADFSIEEADQEAYVYMNGAVQYTFEQHEVAKMIGNHKEKREVQNKINSAISFYLENVELDEEDGKLQVRCDISTNDYSPDPDGFHEFLSWCEDIDDEYDKDYYKVRQALVGAGILRHPHSDDTIVGIENNKFRNFESFIDEDNGSVVIHIPKMKIGNLNNDNTELLQFNSNRITNAMPITDNSPGFDQFKKLLLTAIADKIKTAYAAHNKAQYLPGFEKFKPLFQFPMKANTVKPQINFTFNGNNKDVSMEIVWEIPVNATKESAQQTVKLLRFIDDQFDSLLSNVLRQFWLIVTSKYSHPKTNVNQKFNPQPQQQGWQPIGQSTGKFDTLPKTGQF